MSRLKRPLSLVGRACLVCACGRGLIHTGKQRRTRGDRERVRKGEGESHEAAVVRASGSSVCDGDGRACVRARRLDRRLLGPNEGRRREAKDDARLEGFVYPGRERWGASGDGERRRGTQQNEIVGERGV